MMKPKNNAKIKYNEPTIMSIMFYVKVQIDGASLLKVKLAAYKKFTLFHFLHHAKLKERKNLQKRQQMH
jgi:hypothetical protein